MVDGMASSKSVVVFLFSLPFFCYDIVVTWTYVIFVSLFNVFAQHKENMQSRIL